jgi:hypothetical protein
VSSNRFIDRRGLETGRHEVGMSFRNNTFVVLLPLHPQTKEHVRIELDALGDDITARNTMPLIPFADMVTLESARILVLPANADSPVDRMMLSTVFDGTLDDHLRELTTVGHAGLDQLFRRCEGYPAGATPEQLKAYLVAHRIQRRAFHIGSVGSTISEVREEARLRDALQDFIDERRRAGAWRTASVERIRSEIGQFVRSRPDLPQALRPPPTLAWRLAKFANLLGVFATLFLPFVLAGAVFQFAVFGTEWAWVGVPVWSVLFLAVTVGILTLILRRHERAEQARFRPVTWDNVDVNPLTDREDLLGQNQISLFLPVKVGWFRAFSMRFSLWAAHALSCHYWNKGKLVGVDTIHFARFFLIDGEKRMVFLSHYDGSWDRYLTDFLTVGAFAVIPIWANLEGCPPTRYQINPTPRFPEYFLPFIRQYQVVTQAWYVAYPDLSLTNVLRNAQIREGLFTPLTLAEAREWLALL